MKSLFMKKVMDPRKTNHYTGTLTLNTLGHEHKNKWNLREWPYQWSNEASAEQLFYHLISDIAGMTKDCLELIYDEVKEKSQRMNVWKGSRKTKTGKLQDKYIEVVYFRY